MQYRTHLKRLDKMRDQRAYQLVRQFWIGVRTLQRDLSIIEAFELERLDARSRSGDPPTPEEAARWEQWCERMKEQGVHATSAALEALVGPEEASARINEYIARINEIPEFKRTPEEALIAGDTARSAVWIKRLSDTELDFLIASDHCGTDEAAWQAFKAEVEAMISRYPDRV